jgi:predicted metal-binding protein
MEQFFSIVGVQVDDNADLVLVSVYKNQADIRCGISGLPEGLRVISICGIPSSSYPSEERRKPKLA